LSRDYFIHDAGGKRHVSEIELPLAVGGKDRRGVVLPGAEDDQLVAFVALSDGHAYIQPASENEVIFHNNERLTDSVWLKSGDRVQIGDALLSWEVQGDKVLIDVLQQPDMHQPQPPMQPPPGQPLSRNDELPVIAVKPDHGDGRKRKRYFIIFVSVLLLSAIYLLMTISVVIKVEPKPDTLDMSGFPPPLHLWGTRLAMPGSYSVSATLPGYKPLQEEIEIKRGGVANLSYVLEELPGLVSINTTPDATAHVFVDSNEVTLNKQGKAEISRGTHQLRIETERYQVFETEIEVKGYGENQLLEVALEPAWALVAITSDPVSADVRVDGKYAGKTPLEVEILQGRHEIVLEKEGFKPLSLVQSVTAGEDITIDTVKLSPVDGQLTVNSSPEGASVMLDDKYLGVTPLTLNVDANLQQTLRFSKAGYTSKEQSVILQPGEEQSIDVKLVPGYSTVFLNIRPDGATVMLDGKKVDSSTGRLRLTTRPHTLVVIKPGYVTQRITVTPQQGVSQNVNVTLQQAGQKSATKKLSATADSIATVTGQRLQLIKPGSTLSMGASRREAGRRANESQRQVKLKRPFYFSHNEVTNGDFRQFRSSHDSGSTDRAALNGDTQPVVNISWDDAARFTNWLSKQQGLPEAYTEQSGKMVAVMPMNTGYRLPTEAEWAWVARKQGQKTEQRYPWLGRFPPVVKSGNYADERIADTLADTVPGYDDGFRGTAPVASFPAWPKGFYDLGGNVAEWMHDYYAIYPGEANQLVTDPSGPVSGEHRVVRGSSWRHGNITELRLSYRDYSSKPRYDLGFRVARYAE
jgi:formylglycine-generating enzyme required for sulfatase activity